MSAPQYQAQHLTQDQARQRLAENGPNELPRSAPKSVLHLLRNIITEPIFLLLISCGAIYMLLGDLHEALMLLGFVFVVMTITFVQQRRTERSLEALRDISSPRALVVRGEKICRIAGRELVYGDLVLLSEGDRVPADLCLIDSSNLMIDESMLTGESMPVAKHVKEVRSDTSRDHTARVADAYSGTLVTQGTARGYVVATGEHSALRKIGKSLSEIGNEDTPIQIETGQIVKKIAIIGMMLAAGLAVAYGIIRGDWLNGLLVGLTLAMAILPEELPVVLTLFLGLSAWRLSREHVLTRSIPAIELLGATTLLCVDKTGTLTANHMVVRQLWSDTDHHDLARHAKDPLPEGLHALLEYAILASHRQAFDPMESAIIQAGQQLLTGTEHLHTDWELIRDYPLSRELLAMSRVWQSSGMQARLIAAKGSPESIIDLCHLDATRTQRINEQINAMANQGLRVIGVAQVKFEAKELPALQHDFAFEFLGLLALEDPVRHDVPQAIAECHAAGIRVVMITGDHPSTASSIAKQAGILNPEEILSGTELDALSEQMLDARLGQTNVFCRVRPEQKLRLVQAFRTQGEIVAMTGDGVNDAPALKAAHIGVAMGARGTDVAREAAALVLLDDQFSSLLTAIKQGRRVFANLRKAIIFIVAVHIPVIGLSLLPIVFGWPILLMPVHILFLQLVIDPACSVVFEAEPLEPRAMQTKPRKPLDRLFEKKILLHGLFQGVGLLILLAGLYLWSRSQVNSEGVSRAMLFSTLVLSSLGLIYSNRSWYRAKSAIHPASNQYAHGMSMVTIFLLGLVLGVPSVSRLFAFDGLSTLQILGCITIAGIAFLWFEGLKHFQHA